MRPATRLMFVELNEINFEYLSGYIAQGELPNFKRFFDEHGYVKTISERAHERVNPWIQWVTAHTGLDYAEHKVLRMGDMYYNDHEQMWERLERAGLKVGALAPFNSTNKTKDAAFFMPDPWMRTPVAGPKTLHYVHDALVQVADDYAANRIAPSSILKLGVGALAHMQWKNLPKYGRDIWRYLRRGRWHRALVADRLLGDVFISLWRRYRPDFASVCVNAGAHLQHHYMFSSPLCDSPLHNPEWWLPEGMDPVLESYRLYDELLGDLQRADPEARIMLVTALHQEAHERPAHYYRLDEHEKVFKALDIPFDNIHPLMTEDFVVEYADEEAARTGQRMIEEVKASANDVFYAVTGDFSDRGADTAPQAFFVDNRGSTLYVQLKPTARLIPEGMSVSRGNIILPNFPSLISHAQLKNGHHTGDGYFADSHAKPGNLPAEFPLKEVYDRVLRAFGIEREARPLAAGSPQAA